MTGNLPCISGDFVRHSVESYPQRLVVVLLTFFSILLVPRDLLLTRHIRRTLQFKVTISLLAATVKQRSL
jgi:hypothetical protein